VLAIVVVSVLGVGTAVTVINNRAYDRGEAAAKEAAREQIQRMEERLAKRMRENEGLTDPEIDCQLRRLRNPKAECGK
jgi:hypothetical protein